MVSITDLPLELQAHILGYPVTFTLAETLRQSSTCCDIALHYIKHLLKGEEEETYILSSSILKLPYIQTISGYKIFVECLDDLIDISIEMSSLTTCDFDISLLGLNDSGKIGYLAARAQLISRLHGKYFKRIREIIYPHLFPPATGVTLRPDDVANYITPFIIYSTFFQTNPTHEYKFRFFSGNRFLLELSNNSIQVTKNGYFSEINSIIRVTNNLSSFTGIIGSDAIIDELKKHISTLKEVRIYTRKVDNISLLTSLLDIGLKRVGLADPWNIKRDKELYLGEIKKFLEDPKQYPEVESFLPVDYPDIPLLFSKFPRIKVVDYFSISLREHIPPQVEGVKFNLI